MCVCVCVLGGGWPPCTPHWAQTQNLLYIHIHARARAPPRNRRPAGLSWCTTAWRSAARPATRWRCSRTSHTRGWRTLARVGWGPVMRAVGPNHPWAQPGGGVASRGGEPDCALFGTECLPSRWKIPPLPRTGLLTHTDTRTHMPAGFLTRFEGSQCPAKLLEEISIIDTPGVLSGEKQRIGARARGGSSALALLQDLSAVLASPSLFQHASTCTQTHTQSASTRSSACASGLRRAATSS